VSCTTCVVPYYIISKDNTPIPLTLPNNVYADIFVYGTPLLQGTNNYYLPNINIYKNVLLTKTFNYKIYKDRITKIDNINNNNITEIPVFANPTIRNPADINIELNVYECENKRNDLCNENNLKENYKLNQRIFTTYTTNPLGNSIQRTSNHNDNDILTLISNENYDFDPTSGGNSRFGKTNINKYVLQQPFIVIKITNDTITTVETIDETINKFKRQMNIFEINTTLFLLNKNTKKIVDFTKDYHLYNDKQYANAFLTNSKIYDRNQQAYYILKRDIMYNYYSKFLIACILVILLGCFMLYHYYKSQKLYIIILGVILILTAIITIVYDIIKHQHMDSSKYYFIKPHNFR
jgi:hypothetical protein